MEQPQRCLSTPLSSSLSYPSVAKLFTSHQIVPQRVQILYSVQTLNFRGKLLKDKAAAFKLETTTERNAPSLKLEYFPSASVTDGLGAMPLAAYEIMNPLERDRPVPRWLMSRWRQMGQSQGLSILGWPGDQLGLGARQTHGLEWIG